LLHLKIASEKDPFVVERTLVEIKIQEKQSRRTKKQMTVNEMIVAGFSQQRIDSITFDQEGEPHPDC
jgi:hypothetical protein